MVVSRASRRPSPCVPAALRAATAPLLRHPLLARLQAPGTWRIFMQHHVFAVWDFMSLLKRLQRDLSCVQLPWRPPRHPQHARFVNALVLAEESDEDGRGGHLSHFVQYLEAMDEAGADSGPARRFCAALGDGVDVGAALAGAGAPPGARSFVTHTLGVALRGSTVEVAASFFWGREAILADIFAGVLARHAAAGHNYARLRHYLARHVELDGDEHGPMAAALLQTLIAAEPAAAAAATAAGVAALQQRGALWDSIVAALPRAAAAPPPTQASA